MSKLSTDDKTMIADGAEFKVGNTYFKHIRNVLHRCRLSSTEWVKDHTTEAHYRSMSSYIDLQRTETPVPQEFSSKQGDCIAIKVHSLCVELQLMYSYLPNTDDFLVDYDGMEFKLKTFDDIGKLRCMISLMGELSYGE